MLEQLGSTRWSRLARHVEHVECDVTSQVEFGLYYVTGGMLNLRIHPLTFTVYGGQYILQLVLCCC